MIYADNAATTQMSKAAINAMLYCMEETWGNPSSLYGLGQRAKEALEDARERLAACIGASGMALSEFTAVRLMIAFSSASMQRAPSRAMKAG